MDKVARKTKAESKCSGEKNWLYLQIHTQPAQKQNSIKDAMQRGKRCFLANTNINMYQGKCHLDYSIDKQIIPDF